MTKGAKGDKGDTGQAGQAGEQGAMGGLNASDHDLLLELNQKVNRLIEEGRNYVYKADFHPVRLLVYGMTSVIFSAFLLAVCAMVFKIATKVP